MSSQKLIKKLLVLMLTMMMVIGNLGMRSTRALAEDEPVSDGEFTSEGVTWEEVDSTTIPGLKPSKPVSENGAKKIEYDKDSIVRVAIVMEGNSTIEAGYSTEAIATNPSAKAYRAQLKANQNLVAQRISEQALGGEKLDVVWNLTLAANVISANVPYIKVERIKSIQGVKDVIIEEAYEAVKPVTPANPDMAISTDMTNTTLVSSDYTGAGQLVAIVDTGLDTDHRSFDPAAFDYAISTLDKDVDLLDRRDVSAVLEELNAYEYLPAVHGSDLYLNTKVPFAFNYIDKNLEVTHDNDTQGEHGSHVSGIAAGNRFVDDGEGNYVDALEEVKTQGQAPDAQILVMKVFGAGGGAYPDDYFAAIEDAIVLGADSINLSLGSSNAGFSMVENEYYFSVFQKLLGSDLVWVNSGGNSYDWAHESLGALYADDVNFATGGSPGTYPHTFTVASVDDDGLIGMPIQAYDHNIFYSDGSSANNAPFLDLGGGEYGYIAIEGYGTEEDMAALADVLQGKIAVIQRGSINFASKANNAVANGALATLIYNNTSPGIAGMNMSGYVYPNPAAAISQDDGLFLIENGEQKTTENGMTYYEGTLKVSDEPVVEKKDAEYYTMSDFSSWGTTGDLNLKPEITAPGGNIWSVNGLVPGGQAYESMSGTSMAAPQISGITAVFKQYAKEKGLDKKTGLSIRQLTQSLLMSTARPLIEEDSGSYYSLMKQGAGLVDTNAAIQSKSVIKVTGTTNNGEAVTRDNYTESYADGKVKAMFGDDPNRGGVYTVDFEILNFSDEDVAYEFSGEMFTQDFFEDSGILFRDTWTIPLDSAVVTFAVNGEPLEASSEEAEGLDFNADGFVNKYDAVALLEYVVGTREEIALEDLADLDKDGDLDTYDAYLALDLLDASTVEAKAGETLSVTATIDLNGSMDELGAEEFNGNYVEGYLFVKEAANDEGALGAEHSIPVFGFFGNWSDASMTDKGSYLEYTYGGEDRFPYVAYADLGYDALEVETFLVKYRGDNTSYIFAGNPLSNDAVYHPERNAINTKDTVSAYRYSLIRNSGGMRFFLTDENGEVLAQMDGGTSLAAYYVASQGAWRSTSASVGLNYRPMDFNDGDRFNLNFEMAPEYYLNEEG
ncbi:MAG: S8 family serine peptidase, partial [Erysipelotrichaceae bacterium]|nr:S8 family serine peptidase [Erysipelotrichaceae bacterium]